MAVTLLSSTGLAPRKNNLTLHIQKSVKEKQHLLHEEKIKKSTKIESFRHLPI